MFRNHKLAIVFVGLAMLFSQVALALHEYDLHTHDGDWGCEICLHSSSADNAITSLPTASGNAITENPPSYLGGPPTGSVPADVRQRAPPLESLVELG